jgi:ATP-binding cassette subfamily C protein CydC
LRPLFAYAPQDAGLIAGTVADNLRLARPGITEAEMWEALEAACLAETVRSLPQGLAEWLGDNGARLSGGQRKRLALARALLAQKPWCWCSMNRAKDWIRKRNARCVSACQPGWIGPEPGWCLVSHRSGLHALARQMVTLDSVSA